ncbi:MAG TPA: hypothetical protein VNN19_11975 [bacterium]|nr:hypothetical protein [bacterium]
MTEPFAAGFVRAINANRTLKDELTAAVRRQSTPRRIAVTHLVNPRQAFFRWIHPEIQPSPERAQVMLAGTGFHDLFGHLVSSEEFVEQFVEYEGIVGKIDIYDDVPVELKTTSSMPDLPRPSYVDQLAMYCTMTGRSQGRLIIYRQTHFGGEPALRAFRAGFSDLPAIRAEMLRRRDLLRAALERRTAGELPRCEWFGRHCDYEAFCGCDQAPAAGRVVPDGACILERDPALETTLGAALASPVARPRGFRLNDLVFPRRSAFERQTPPEDEEAEPSLETRLRELERRAFRETLQDTVRYGIRGAYRTIPVTLRTLSDRVGLFQEMPTRLSTTRLREMVDRRRLVTAFPWIFDRLAFECALSDRAWGRVVLYYELLPDDKFMVYDVAFADLSAIHAEAERRLALLETEASPALLPPCPSWMARTCRYRDRCGCGDAA